MSYSPAKGSVIKLSGVTIGQVKKITPPPMKMNTAETTHLTSAAKEYIATILEGGQPKFTIEWDPASHTTLYTAFKAGTLGAWSIVLANSAGTITFSAIITEFPFAELDPEAVQMVDITLQASGDVTIS